ncbi:MAG: AbrB/MazE/SpoVT family DNA-binding domain-containing protein [Dehalococcoidia bacterium]|nr:MAG: AbrB/MazE/SpoVT family DNA-binding domain-containing protein [Dehalococcoidia bacterium]
MVLFNELPLLFSKHIYWRLAAIVKTSSKGQVLIPKEMRRKLGLREGRK